MARIPHVSLLLLLGLGALAGCGKFERAERPAWRTRAENACLADGKLRFSAYVQPSREIDGPSICGLTRPLKVTALQGGAVLFNTTQTFDCPMVVQLDAWLAEVVQPAAQARFGQPVAEIDSMGSYNCRGMNNQIGARLSEHSFGNALDIGGFRLADGRQITLARDWTRGDPETRAFLRDVHNGACGQFATVLSPGANALHYNHIHVDLAMHGVSSSGPRRICKPAPQMTEPPSRKDSLPEAPDIEDDLDIAQAGAAPVGRAYALHSGPDLALAAATIQAAKPASPAEQSPPLAAVPLPPRRPTAPIALHGTPVAAPAAAPARGEKSAAREGRLADFDLPASRFTR
jgi:hypothetical protein